MPRRNPSVAQRLNFEARYLQTRILASDLKENFTYSLLQLAKLKANFFFLLPLGAKSKFCFNRQGFGTREGRGKDGHRVHSLARAAMYCSVVRRSLRGIALR